MRHSSKITIHFAPLVFASCLFIGCQSTLRIVSTDAGTDQIAPLATTDLLQSHGDSNQLSDLHTVDPIASEPIVSNEEATSPLTQPSPIPLPPAMKGSNGLRVPTLADTPELAKIALPKDTSPNGTREQSTVEFDRETANNDVAPIMAPVVSSGAARLWIQGKSEQIEKEETADAVLFVNSNDEPAEQPESELEEQLAPVEDSARPYFATVDATIERRQADSPSVTFPFSIDANPLLFTGVSPTTTSFISDGDLIPPTEDEYVVSDEIMTEAFSLPEDCPTIVDQTIDGSSCLPGFSIEDCGSCQNVSSLPPLSMPDEYICDGGVQNPNVRVSKNWKVPGLELEDTIAHYDSLDGRTLVKPSNRVCIYAPRFASVRKISGAFENEQIVDTNNVVSPVSAVIDEQTDRYLAVDKALAAKHDVGIGGALIFRDRNRGVSLDNHVPVQEVARAIRGHEDFQFMQIGVAKRSEKALLDERIQAAAVWTKETGAQVLIDNVEAIVDTKTQATGIVVHTDDSGDPRLRIVKIASTHSAQPGDEVEFTLRFDNIGDQPIGNVTLIDNPTTRLEYVEKSAQCSLDAQFSSDENKGDSLVLRWEIDEPLRPGQGGIIRFKCTVR